MLACKSKNQYAVLLLLCISCLKCDSLSCRMRTKNVGRGQITDAGKILCNCEDFATGGY